MRLAFVYIAEPYQCYHGAPVALELAAMPGIEVEIFYNEAAVLPHLRRIEEGYGAGPLSAFPLVRPMWVAIAQRMKIFGLMKRRVRYANVDILRRYDAVISVENTLADLFDERPNHPPLIYMPHGSGDRAIAFHPRIAKFDLVLPSGTKSAGKMLELGLIRPGHYSTPGYVKLEAMGRIQHKNPKLFADQKPVVLYNPHKDKNLGSWRTFIDPLLAQFQDQSEFNLIVAPHVKMFHRTSQRIRNRWEARSNERVLLDTGSDRSMDNSYTEIADIYVGDVSSQIYEFLARPRPCVFLNANGADWRNDPHYRFWHLGDVVDSPSELMEAIRLAPSRHHLYRAKQEEAVARTLGDIRPGAARRAAEAIVKFIEDGRVAT